MELLSRMALYQIGCWGWDPISGLSSEIQNFWSKTRPTHVQRDQGPQPSCPGASAKELWKQTDWMLSHPQSAGRGVIPAHPGPAFPSHLCCRCSVTKLCPTLRDPMDCRTPGFPVPHHLLAFVQVHVHWIRDAIQPSHPLSSPSPPAFNLSQHQGLFQWVSSSYQMAKVLEFQLQHQSFQWTPRTDLL